MMGVVSAGCHWAIDSLWDTGQVSGECTTVPGLSAPSNTFSACVITLLCWGILWGCPRVCPNGNSSAKERGTPILSAQKGIMVTRMVANPAASRVRANTGTLMAQSGQAGVNRTQSTLSFINSWATCGP